MPVIINCPVTGIPVYREKEWENISFGNQYTLTISLLGNNILLTEASGYATIEDVAPASQLLRNIISRTFPGKHTVCTH